MWNNLLKLTLISWLWKRYQRTIIAFPLLLLYFWLINLIHSDVITYATLNDNKTWLGWTFLVKWLFIFLGIIIFVLVHLNGRQVSKKSRDNLQQKMQAESREKEGCEDAFSVIRQKEKLRSRAEVILEKKR